MSNSKTKVRPIQTIYKSEHEKVIVLLQFCRKSGNLIWGLQSCLSNIRFIKLLLLTKDITQNSRHKIMNAVKRSNIELKLFIFSTRDELSEKLGLPYVTILGITDNNFALKISEYLMPYNLMEEH